MIRGTIAIKTGRYSIPLWLIMVSGAVVVGGLLFLLARLLPGWDEPLLLPAFVIVALLGEVLVAMEMEMLAPSRIDIGPGEKNAVSDRPSETATVIAGFDASDTGRVSIRGETWRAVLAPGESGSIRAGTAVRVVERNGLTLVVSAKTS